MTLLGSEYVRLPPGTAVTKKGTAEVCRISPIVYESRKASRVALPRSRVSTLGATPWNFVPSGIGTSDFLYDAWDNPARKALDALAAEEFDDLTYD
jgi:hypothetical protein